MSLLQTRQEERDELQDLNDRLAVYMTRMREYKDTIDHLNTEITVVKSSHVRELRQLKTEYDTELELARKGLDETAKEKAQFQIEAGRQSQRANEAETAQQVAEAECARLRGELQSCMQELSQTQGELTTAKKAVFEAQQSLAGMTDARDTYKGLYEQEQMKCEAEALAKVTKENELLSAQEELSFRQQTHTTTITNLNLEIDELRAKVMDTESRLKRKYEKALAEALQNSRDLYEEAAETFRNDLHEFYRNQLGDIVDDRDTAKAACAKARNELQNLRGEHSGNLAKLAGAEKQIGALEGRNKTLENQLDLSNTRHAEDIKERDDHIDRLRQQASARDKAYQELMDIRIALDAEIAAYRKLLEMEETRLGIPVTPGRNSNRKRPREETADEAASEEKANKRPRLVYTEAQAALEAVTETAGPVHIEELNLDGFFVKLTNLEEEEVSLEQWTLTTQNAEGQSAVFSFPAGFSLAGSASVLVWTASSPGAHNPPSDLLWREQDALFTTAKSELVLTKSDGTEASHCTLVAVEAELYNQAPDPGSCALM